MSETKLKERQMGAISQKNSHRQTDRAMLLHEIQFNVEVLPLAAHIAERQRCLVIVKTALAAMIINDVIVFLG